MRNIIAILMLMLIIAVGIYEQFYIKDVFGELEGMIEEIKSAIQEEDIENAQNLIEAADDWWIKKLKVLDTIEPHTLLKDISFQMSELKGQIEAGEKEQALAACIVLLGSCETVPHLLGFHPEHLF